MNHKSVKKIERKLNKLKHVVFKETGIICSLNPTKNIVICNAGLVNGLSEETILEHFSVYGTLNNIVLVPGKSCSFVSYLEIDMACKAFEALNGQLTIAQDNKPVYLLYAEYLPQSIDSRKVWDKLPPGLVILEDFITESEEKVLLSLCHFEDSLANQMKNRQVRHFGYEFRYDNNNVDKDKPLDERIPTECNFLWDRLNETTQWSQFIPDQLTVNHYSPGQGIPHHIDTHSAFEGPIMSLSLNSTVVMNFKRDNRDICVTLPPRSLCIMSGESRYDWTHGIIPRKSDVILSKTGSYTLLPRGVRVSFTFRKIRTGDCSCQYTRNCDSYIQKSNSELQIAAAEIERLHVLNVYENIATHFNETRNKPWPNVLEFVNSFDIGSVVLDVGCGNGKYLGENKQIFDVGCDTSFGLLDVCRTNRFETFLTNCLYLPFKDAIADGVISIAVIHHLASEERRLQAIEEMIRVLKVNGRALIYVWAKDQLKNNEKTSYIKQDRKNRKPDSDVVVTEESAEAPVPNGISLPVHVNRTQFKHKDVLVPWRLKSQQNTIEDTFLRFYHVFEDNELSDLCCKLDNVQIERCYYDQGNWCIVLRKTLIKGS
nr:unnamed protein product [Callosobruchus analis]